MSLWRCTARARESAKEFYNFKEPTNRRHSIQRKDGIVCEKNAQLLLKDREIEELKQRHFHALKQRDEEAERQDAVIRGFSAKETALLQEIKRLRRALNGVEVIDVDTGVSEMMEHDDTELPTTRVCREQAVTASVSQALQERLVKVKEEKAETFAYMIGTCHCLYYWNTHVLNSTVVVNLNIDMLIQWWGRREGRQ